MSMDCQSLYFWLMKKSNPLFGKNHCIETIMKKNVFLYNILGRLLMPLER